MNFFGAALSLNRKTVTDDNLVTKVAEKTFFDHLRDMISNVFNRIINTLFGSDEVNNDVVYTKRSTYSSDTTALGIFMHERLPDVVDKKKLDRVRTILARNDADAEKLLNKLRAKKAQNCM